VGAGVLEYRIDFGPGYRLYFGRDGEEIVVLLAGGTKRRQQQDIGPRNRVGRNIGAARKERSDMALTRISKPP